jgi:hypothetical protein
LEREILSTFDPLCTDADKLHKNLCAQRTKFVGPVRIGIASLKNQGKEFLLGEQRREREERERQERERQEAERKAREAQAKIELEQRQAEEARLKAQLEADLLLEEAAEMERQGFKAESDTLLSKAVEATPAPVNYADTIVPLPTPVQPLRIVPPAIKSVPGLGSRKVWKWRIADKTLIPREYLTVNEIVLNALAKTTKSHPEVIPGIEFYEDLEMRRS